MTDCRLSENHIGNQGAMDSQGNMRRVFRVVGPPGTGKTTWLIRQADAALRSACEEEGVSPLASRAVLISTLTKAAAREVRSRGLVISPESIGTLHSHAWQALGRPKLCVDAKSLKPWNDGEGVKGGIRASWRIGESARDSLEVDRGDRGEEPMVSQYHVLRSRMIPREVWPDEVRWFADAYEQWKRLSNLRDFSDVIHDAITSTTAHHVGAPWHIFVDEAQDHDLAELTLVTKWSEHCRTLVIVGDPDQNLYEWRGSDPSAFYDGPQGEFRVLSKSYRVPRAVHRVASAIVGRIARRVPAKYHPRDFDGEFIEVDAAFPEGTGDTSLAELVLGDLRRGKSVMTLSPCFYQLAGLLAQFRESGIPYWNPFAPSRNELNPLHPSRGVSTASRVAAFFLPFDSIAGDKAALWLWSDVGIWCELFGIWRHGSKAAIARQAASTPDGIVGPDELRELVLPEYVGFWESDDPVRFARQHLGPKNRTARFCVDIVQLSGYESLVSEPKLIVGTIHSVKGGEADVVYICPDLSYAGWTEYQNNPDPIHRLYYVAATRARESLKACLPSTTRWYEI